MSIKELDRGKVLEQVRSKQITKVEAAARLGITRQHVDRLSQKKQLKVLSQYNILNKITFL